MSKESGVLAEGKSKCRSCQCYSKRGGARTLTYIFTQLKLAERSRGALKQERTWFESKSEEKALVCLQSQKRQGECQMARK